MLYGRARVRGPLLAVAFRQMEIAKRFRPLTERPFRLLWLGRTSSSVGDALIPVALAFAVLRIGGGATGLGLVLAAFTIGRASFVAVGGVWADRCRGGP